MLRGFNRFSVVKVTALALLLSGLSGITLAGPAMAAGSWAAWAGSTPGGASGLSNIGNALAIDGSTVYVGTGPTNSACGTSRGEICKWDGTQWTTIGAAASSTNAVDTLLIRPGTHDLYAAGAFDVLNGVPGTARIAMYNGTTWAPLPAMSGTDLSTCANAQSGALFNDVTAMAFDPSGRYLAVSFTTAASICLLDLNTNTWSFVGRTISGSAYSLQMPSASVIYAGGSFATGIQDGNNWNVPIANTTYLAAATLSGGVWVWSALGGGAQSTVRTVLATDVNTAYFGGDFSAVKNAAGSNVANTGYAAKWDGTQWVALGTGPNAQVYDLEASGNTLYAAGNMSGYATSFDGTAWSALGFGLRNGKAVDLAVNGAGEIVATGEFLQYWNDAGHTVDTAASYIATWSPPVTAPGTPTGVTGVPGDGQVVVSWTAPTSDGGATITTYTVTASSGQTCTANGSPAATTCTVTGLTNGTPVTFTVTATNSAGPSSASSASTAITPVPSGGGSSGGGGAVPTPEVVSTPSPTPTAPVGTSVPTADPLAPLTIPDNPAVGAKGGALAEGGSMLLVGGRQTPLTVQADKPVDATGLNLASPGFSMWIAGRGDINDPLGLTPKSALILQSEQGAQTRAKKIKPYAELKGTGFKPNSEVQVWLLPKTYVGTVPIDGEGNFSGSIDIPKLLALGGNTLQVNGFTPDGVVRSVSLGINVIARQLGAKRTTAVTYFSANSSQLAYAAKRSLDAFVRGVPKTAKGVTVNVTGFVQPTSFVGNDKSLSSARAKAVSSYLRAKGLKGSYAISGKGRALQAGAAARRAVSVVAYWR